MLTIYTNGAIALDGKMTGFGVSQGKHGTQVYTAEGPGVRYAEHQMPAKRYLLANSSPITKPGVASRAQFEADICALLAAKVAA